MRSRTRVGGLSRLGEANHTPGGCASKKRDRSDRGSRHADEIGGAYLRSVPQSTRPDADPAPRVVVVSVWRAAKRSGRGPRGT